MGIALVGTLLATQAYVVGGIGDALEGLADLVDGAVGVGHEQDVARGVAVVLLYDGAQEDGGLARSRCAYDEGIVGGLLDGVHDGIGIGTGVVAYELCGGIGAGKQVAQEQALGILGGL